jgi:L,D-peptidoglycan transpeptidase YkuD (ErfK/YbiS/YcfS/YnhG family)
MDYCIAKKKIIEKRICFKINGFRGWALGRLRGMRWAVVMIGMLVGSGAYGQVGKAVRQLIVVTAADWNASTAVMQCYERDSERQAWRSVLRAGVPVNLGREGLAWGRGVFDVPQNGGAMKREKDWRAPAGIFQLGALFGYAPAPPAGARWPYVQVGPWDAYVDDSANPYYNQHVRVKPGQVPAWFEKQRMRLGDAAYKWMLEIRHNQRPAVPQGGSAIFFHVRRGPTRPSAGCTTMAVEDLEWLVRWLRPEASPHYVLLPRQDYAALRQRWLLP